MGEEIRGDSSSRLSLSCAPSGKEITRALLLRGAHVVMACRNMESCEQVRRVRGGWDGGTASTADGQVAQEWDAGDAQSRGSS